MGIGTGAGIVGTNGGLTVSGSGMTGILLSIESASFPISFAGMPAFMRIRFRLKTIGIIDGIWELSRAVFHKMKY